MKLQGKVALVTGAGRGIGKVIVLRLADEGAAVVLNYQKTQAGAEAATQAILQAGGRAICLRADVANVAQVREMVRRTVEQFGRLDILVNNAGLDVTVPALETTEEQWDRIVDANLKGTFFCAQAAAGEMLKEKKGRIINISSVHGQATMPGYSAYVAAKGGINSLTRSLALELAPHRITVNAIAPGAIEVEKFTEHPLYDSDALSKEIPLGRVGLPRDISEAVVFLASDAADWLTGQVITIDGGTTTRLFLYAGRPLPVG